MKRALLATLTACLCLSGCQQPQPHLPLPIPESAAIKAGSQPTPQPSAEPSVAPLESLPYQEFMEAHGPCRIPAGPTLASTPRGARRLEPCDGQKP